MMMWNAIRLVLPVAIATVAAAQTPAPQRTQIAGNITAVDAAQNRLTLQTDKGETLNLTATDRTVIVHVPPGENDVKKGTKMKISQLGAGDRVVAFVRPGSDPTQFQVSSLVVRTKADLTAIQQTEQEDWKKRGSVGIVTEVDPAAHTLTVKTGQRTWKAQASDSTQLRRYSADSANPADAKPGTFAEIKAGDQVHVLGNRSEDGTVTAESIYSGTFRQIAATVISVDPSTNELKVTDLATKKPLTVRITPESTMRKLPEQMAQGLARRYQVGGRGAPEGRGGGGGGGRGGDIGAMLDRLPVMPLSELKPKDAIMLSTTQGSDPGRVTAITVLAGVEPILTAAPTATRDIMSGWNLGGAGAEGSQ